MTIEEEELTISSNVGIKGMPGSTRWVYKESYETGRKVKIGILAEDNVIELYPPKDTTIYQPTLYIFPFLVC